MPVWGVLELLGKASSAMLHASRVLGRMISDSRELLKKCLMEEKNDGCLVADGSGGLSICDCKSQDWELMAEPEAVPGDLKTYLAIVFTS